MAWNVQRVYCSRPKRIVEAGVASGEGRLGAEGRGRGALPRTVRKLQHGERPREEQRRRTLASAALPFSGDDMCGGMIVPSLVVRVGDPSAPQGMELVQAPCNERANQRAINATKKIQQLMPKRKVEMTELCDPTQCGSDARMTHQGSLSIPDLSLRLPSARPMAEPWSASVARQQHIPVAISRANYRGWLEPWHSRCRLHSFPSSSLWGSRERL